MEESNKENDDKKKKPASYSSNSYQTQGNSVSAPNKDDDSASFSSLVKYFM